MKGAKTTISMAAESRVSEDRGDSKNAANGILTKMPDSKEENVFSPFRLMNWNNALPRLLWMWILHKKYAS